MSVPHETYFRGTCPHCETVGVSFARVGEYRSRVEGVSVEEVFALIVCGCCERAAMAMFPSYDDYHEHQLTESDVTLHPSAPSAGSVPEHLPERVAQRYSEALSDMRRAARESAAVMFRKTLELSLKTIRPDDDGNLYVRIDKAAEAGAITRDLAEWAHRIRLDGNDAAHEDAVPTAEEIREMQHFTELVLRYVFSLPGMLERWRRREDNRRDDLPF